MPSEMVERCTEALSRIPGGCWLGGGSVPANKCPGIGTVDGCWCERRVLTVLAAMREPTEAMLEAHHAPIDGAIPPNTP